MNFSQSINFKEWIVNEIRSPSIEPNFLSNSVQRLKELERSLRASWSIIEKAIAIEKDFRGWDRNIYDLWHDIPLMNKQFIKTDYVKKPYSDEIQDLLDYRPDNYSRLTNHIKHILQYFGTHKEDNWKSSFARRYKETMTQQYSDGSGGTYIDNIIDEMQQSKLHWDDSEYSYGHAVEVMKKTKEIFKNIAKYVHEVSKVERHLEASVDYRNREEEAYYKSSGGRAGIMPKTNPVEVLYHATPFLKEIQAQGFKVGEKKALGGDTSGGISFTADFDIASEIARNFKEVIAIARNQKGPEDVLRLAKSKGVDLSKAGPYFDYMHQKDLDAKGIPRKTDTYSQDRYYAFELFRHYVSLSPHRYDPLFFGVRVNDFENFDPRNVGVIQAKVDMSKVIEYLSSMEEYRIPPEAILSFKILPV